MKKYLFMLALVISLVSCTKQESVVPFGQQLAAKIQNDLSKTPVGGSIVHIGTTYIATNSRAISFDGEFMLIDQNRYNLNQLIEYAIITGQNGTYIEFYF